MPDIIIRENIPRHMTEIKQWLNENKDIPLELMGDFFTNRIDGYEEHMSSWKGAYVYMAEAIPYTAESLLDIGCGTGLELDEIFRLHPDLKVVGIDLAQVMLDRLEVKHRERNISLICDDYFNTDFGRSCFDVAVSFETLHHFKPDKKLSLFKKLYDSLKPGGLYIEGDYIACCDEEEVILFNECETKRRAAGIHQDTYIHFDTPLTAEHEIELIKTAGFAYAELTECFNGAAIITARKLS